MKTIAIFVLCIAALGFSAFAQSGSTRQRKAPAIKNDSQRSGQPRSSPAIKGGGRTAAEPSMDEPPPPPPSKGDDIISIDTNLVTTPVSVLDRNGRFIPGLKKKDFKIFENGIAQKITYFQSEEQPFTVVLMIDISPSTKYSIDDIHYAAVTFVNQLRPNDKVMVVAFDQRVRVLTEPTSDKQTLYTAIYKSQFGSGTSLYDAVDSVVNMDLMSVPGRKAVVLFTDGVDTTSRQADYGSTIASVEEIDALFYPIRYNTQRKGDQAAQVAALTGLNLPPAALARVGRGQSPAEYEKGRLYLDTLSVNSGGRLFEAETITNLETSFAGIAEELRRQYSVGYYPDDTGKPGDRRKIKIEVARPKVVIRSKTSYVIKQDEPAAANPTGNETVN
jgi:Ca-activated chloride channel family protein